jgi:type II secretory pathway pseudopilin PulG
VCGSAARGFTAAEILAVVAMVSLALLAAGSALTNLRRKTEINTTARLVKSYVVRARMLSVYRGVNHFVVLDPTRKTISIYRDSSAPLGRFDSQDVKVSTEPLPDTFALNLPTNPSPLPNPLGGLPLTDPWSLPIPESAGAWGSTLRGFMTTSAGMIQSAETTPHTIVSGVMVFSDRQGQTSSLALRGQMGIVRTFQLLPAGWKEL